MGIDDRHWQSLCFLKSRSVIFPFHFRVSVRINLWPIHVSWLLRLTVISDFALPYLTYRLPFVCFPVPSKAFSFHLSFGHRIMIEGHSRPTRMGSSSHAHLMFYCVLLKGSSEWAIKPSVRRSALVWFYPFLFSFLTLILTHFVHFFPSQFTLHLRFNSDTDDFDRVRVRSCTFDPPILLDLHSFPLSWTDLHFTTVI